MLRVLWQRKWIVRFSLFTRKSNSHVTGLVRSRRIVGEEHGTNDEKSVP